MIGSGSCELNAWVKVRIRQARCIQRARRGRCSQMRTPGAEVAIGLNSPRISAGASGLRLTMSWWLGPPRRLKRMTDLAGPRGRAGPASARRRRESPTPANSDRDPTRIASRRETLDRWLSTAVLLAVCLWVNASSLPPCRVSRKEEVGRANDARAGRGDAAPAGRLKRVGGEFATLNWPRGELASACQEV